jgi:hypothetical protein
VELNLLNHTLFLLQLGILFPFDIRESPLLRNNDLLTTRELVTSTTESLLDDLGIGVFASYRDKNLSNVDASNGTIGFAPSTTHTGLKSR